MGKRRVLFILCGVTLLGAILMLAGFANGGHLGSITVQGGQVIYATGQETVELMRVPRWAQGIHFVGWNGFYSGASDIPAGAGANERPLVEAPFDGGELREIDIDVAAGYVVIQQGDAYRLEVDGPLAYTSAFEGGVWKISAPLGSYTVRDRMRFWWDGKDMTTTFTLTVPGRFDRLRLVLGAGQAQVEGLELGSLRCEVDAGRLLGKNLEAQSASLSASAGTVEMTGAVFGECDLHCDVGSIEFSGRVEGRLQASCSLGRIAAALPRPNDYGWQAEVDLGRIRIDGETVGSGFAGASSGGSRDAAPYFDLTCDLGSIEIAFTR